MYFFSLYNEFLFFIGVCCFILSTVTVWFFRLAINNTIISFRYHMSIFVIHLDCYQNYGANNNFPYSQCLFDLLSMHQMNEIKTKVFCFWFSINVFHALRKTLNIFILSFGIGKREKWRILFFFYKYLSLWMQIKMSERKREATF